MVMTSKQKVQDPTLTCIQSAIVAEKMIKVVFSLLAELHADCYCLRNGTLLTILKGGSCESLIIEASVDVLLKSVGASCIIDGQSE